MQNNFVDNVFIAVSLYLLSTVPVALKMSSNLVLIILSIKHQNFAVGISPQTPYGFGSPDPAGLDYKFIPKTH